MEKDEWVVWSREHDAFWKPARWGYTPHLGAAGIYSKADAIDIVHKAEPGNEIAFPRDLAILASLAGQIPGADYFADVRLTNDDDATSPRTDHNQG